MSLTSTTQKPLTLALLGVALTISSWMAWVALRSGAIAGCGEGCSTVLSSHWAYVGPIPASLIGAILYLGAFIALLRANPLLTRILAAIILAGALYFFAIQALILRAFCPWCCATHLAASAAGVLALRLSPATGKRRRFALPALAAASSIALFASLQHFAPHQPGSLALTAADVTYLTPAPNGDWLAYGTLSITPAALPQLASRSTDYALPPVFLLHDWTCHHCSELHLRLEALAVKDALTAPLGLLSISREPEGLAISSLMASAWIAAPERYNATSHAITHGHIPATLDSVRSHLGPIELSPEQISRRDHLLDTAVRLLQLADAHSLVSTLP